MIQCEPKPKCPDLKVIVPAGCPPRVGILGYQILVVDNDLRQYHHSIMAPVENIHQAQMQRDDVLENFAAVASNHAMDVKGVLAPAPRTTLRRRRVNVGVGTTPGVFGVLAVSKGS